MFPAEALIFSVVLLGLAALSTVKAVGAKLAEPTQIDDDGVVCVANDAGELVQADPEALARGAGMDANAYAAARVIESEAGGQPFIAQVGVCWTIVNHARAQGRSVLAVVTRATLHKGKDDGVGDGFFGRQGSPTGGYRYVASSRDTTQDARDIATAVLAGDIADPTGGALNFDAPGAYGIQDGTTAAGADAFAAARQAEGKELFQLAGAPAIRFWRPA